MVKDPGNQSLALTAFAGFLSWLQDQQNLMFLSLCLGILTALVNMCAKLEERKARRRERERAEEIHKLKVARLKQGLDDDPKNCCK